MLSPYELRTCLVSSRNLSFPLQASHAKTDTDTVPLPLTERLHELPTVEVEHRYWEGARAAWQSENQGRYWANLYYDCDREADRILDEGKELPGLRIGSWTRIHFLQVRREDCRENTRTSRT